MLLKEFESATNFKEDFFKVVEFLHYLEDEGYDMKTFERVKRNQWIFNTLEKEKGSIIQIVICPFPPP